MFRIHYIFPRTSQGGMTKIRIGQILNEKRGSQLEADIVLLSTGKGSVSRSPRGFIGNVESSNPENRNDTPAYKKQNKNCIRKA